MFWLRHHRKRGWNVRTTFVPNLSTFDFFFLLTHSTLFSHSLLPEKLQAYGIPPGPIYKKIKANRFGKLRLDDGRIINCADFVQGSRKGRKIVILGDTYDPYAISEEANGADVVLHEATLEDRMRGKAVERAHSTAVMAAKFAAKINAKHLILNHFSQKWANDRSRMNGEIKLAKEHFPNIIAARDLQRIAISKQDGVVTLTDVTEEKN